MRSFKIDDIYIDDLVNTRKLPDIFKYRCITKDRDILNKNFINELAKQININPLDLEIYHTWFKIQDKYYYFKYYYIFEEIFMEKVFEYFKVPCIKHKLVNCNGKVGIISENFRKKDCEYIDYADIISKDTDVPLSIIKYNEIIETKMKKFDFNIYLGIVSKIIAIDIMFGQFDHRYYNIMFEKSNEHLKLAPMFDNGNIFKENNRPDTYTFESCFDTLVFSANENHIDEHTIETITNYPELYKSLEKALDINLSKIFNKLKRDFQMEVYVELKEQIQKYYDLHCKMVEKTLKLVDKYVI